VQIEDFEEDYSDALFFLEAQVVTPDEESTLTRTNNVSYKSVGFYDDDDPETPPIAHCTSRKCSGLYCNGLGNCIGARSCTGAGCPCIHDLILESGGECQTPAIYAWGGLASGVEYDVIDVPNDGRLILAAKATDKGAFGWDYEYVLYNQNSDRAVGSFELTFSGTGGQVIRCHKIGFHGVKYHSGEIWDATNWTASSCTVNVPMTTLKWETLPFAHGANANANALRWGTLYNFRYRSTSGPHSGGITATIGLFKPPAAECIDTGCSGDCPSCREVTTIGP